MKRTRASAPSDSFCASPMRKKVRFNLPHYDDDYFLRILRHTADEHLMYPDLNENQVDSTLYNRVFEHEGHIFEMKAERMIRPFHEDGKTFEVRFSVHFAIFHCQHTADTFEEARAIALSDFFGKFSQASDLVKNRFLRLVKAHEY